MRISYLIKWSNTAFSLRLLLLCSLGRDETVVCIKGDGGCIMNEVEDCRKKKEVISWSRWFNATLEKLGFFFPFLCNRVVLRQVISQSWGGGGEGDLPQLSAGFSVETIEVLGSHLQKCWASAAVAENCSGCALDIEAVIYYKLLWEIKAWISRIAYWKFSYFDLSFPMFPFIICRIRIIVLSLLAGDSICSLCLGDNLRLWRWAVRKFRRKLMGLSLQHSSHRLLYVCHGHWTSIKQSVM